MVRGYLTELLVGLQPSHPQSSAVHVYIGLLLHTSSMHFLEISLDMGVACRASNTVFTLVLLPWVNTGFALNELKTLIV